jgi:beta-phosphoglucomutase-like phosphatase (HAD superfamily)
MKRTVVFDFDGVIHSYTSGWKGPNIIPDPPVPGIKEAIAEIRAAGYEVVVVSTRCAFINGLRAIEKYLNKYGIEVDDIQKEKPPAIVYIDDRAICFDGNPAELLGKIQNFRPWNK